MQIRLRNLQQTHVFLLRLQSQHYFESASSLITNLTEEQDRIGRFGYLNFQPAYHLLEKLVEHTPTDLGLAESVWDYQDLVSHEIFSDVRSELGPVEVTFRSHHARYGIICSTGGKRLRTNVCAGSAVL